MNRKLVFYKIACYVNLYSSITMLVIILYRIITTLFTRDGKFKGTEIDILGFVILFLILIILGGNFFYGIKLLERIYKGQGFLTYKNGLRILFFILEIIVALLFSLGIYQIISQFEFTRFWNLPGAQLIIYVLVHVCLFTSFLSSIIRIILTSYVLKQARLMVKSEIDLIGAQ